jgi:hypothetical protein
VVPQRLGGGGSASLSGPGQQDGGFGTGFRGVKDRAEILEVADDLAERLAVPGGEGAGVGGASGHQVAVDLSSQSGEAGGHLAGMAETGQAVQRADSADDVTDLLAKIGRRLKLPAGGGEVAQARACSTSALFISAAGRPRASCAASVSAARPACPAGLPGHGQRLRGGGIGPLGRERAPELLEEVYRTRRPGGRRSPAGLVRGAEERAIRPSRRWLRRPTDR